MILRPLFNVPPEHLIDDVDIHRLAPLRPRPLDQPEPETPVPALERLRPPVCRLQPHLLREPEETAPALADPAMRSEEHTSELQSLMCISYAVFCLKNKIRLHPHI